MSRTVIVGQEGKNKIRVGEGQPVALISGPCVVESEEVMFTAARRLVEISQEVGAPLIFKSSYEKDNRTSATAYRGPGLDQGLELLRRLRERFAFPLLSDVHRAADVNPAAEVLDLLQVPAFLCRQTSLLETVGSCGRPVNIKKGQFLSPEAIAGAVDKVRQAGCDQVLLTERGSCFGYDQLVCDMTSISTMCDLGCPVIIDAGHAANRRDQIPLLARCGVAAGADALYLESHPDPASASCDGSRMLSLEELRQLLLELAPLARWRGRG